MKISYNWLKWYVDFSQTPEELSVILTDAGLEVESLEHFESIKGGLKNVVIAKVASCRKHPGADRLSLTTVDTGEAGIFPVVCGAPNVAEGQMVVFAMPGAVLNTAQGPLEIKKTRIRGEESMGMICAEDELGIGTSHQGIMVLPDDATIGMPAAEYFNVQQDWIFEIGLTPNRIDAASHIGVARDIVAVINHQNNQRLLQLKKPDISDFHPSNNDLYIAVTIEDEEACPRYCGVTISGVKVEESPGWLKNILKSIGLKPINNVVDITNFVLHEMGQPLHAFNADSITEKHVVIRKPQKGTRFVTLDEEEIELTGNDLMICNGHEPMCIAGVLGGKLSGVDHSTRNIFLESAYFNPATIRRTARRYGLNTDASFRFERGADPQITDIALKRAALLICQIAGGQISSELVDEYPEKKQPVVVDLNLEKVNALIGNSIPLKQIRSILHDLDIQVLEEDNNHLKVSIPLYRVDVTREADVVEEILRIYGYNNVELPSRLFSSIVLSPKPDMEAVQNNISDMLSSRGFFEIINNSLTKNSYFESFGFDPSKSVNILNPLSQDLNVMRQSLLFGGLETIASNRNRKVMDMKLFEFGNIYEKDQYNTKNNALKGYSERMMLSVFLTGNRSPETWNIPQKAFSFFDLKDAVVNIFGRLNLDEDKLEINDQERLDLFKYQLQYLMDGELIATVGLLSNQVLKAFDIKQEVFYAELEWETIVKLSDANQVLYREVSKFPEVRRDLALLIDSSITFETIRKTARETGRKMLKAIRLFDVYEDEKLGGNKKSYAVSFTIQDENKTLTDKEIDNFMQRMEKELVSRLGAEIRGH
jgi:phenylalanyl-tRNA synthetase beta chain